jgi:hypothetical protein
MNATTASNNSILLYANDTLNNINLSSRTWNYRLFTNHQTLNTTVNEGNIEDFILNVTYWDSSLSISAALWHNNTRYVTANTGSGANGYFVKELTMPNVDAATTKYAMWEVTLSNSSNTYYYNLTNFTQTINAFNMSICGVPYNATYINFTAVPENETGTNYNFSFEVTFTYGQVGGSQTETFSYSNTSSTLDSFAFCFYPNTTSFLVDAVIEFSAPGHEEKNFDFQDWTLTPATQNYTLLLMPTALSTSFIVEVVDGSNNPYSDVMVQIEKYFPGVDQWNISEIVTTDENGASLAHFEEEDAYYRFLVYDGTTLLYTSDSMEIVCGATPCTITIKIQTAIDDGLDDFTDLEDLTSSLTYNHSNYIVTYSWADSSGDFSQAILTVRRTAIGNASDDSRICNSTSALSTQTLTPA